MNFWKHERKKCGKLRIRDIFLSPRAITSWKNQWIKTKLENDLYLGIVKQYTKYAMNTCKHERKKCGKLRIRDIFLSPRAITSWKSMNQNQTRTWSVSWYGKAMYQTSNKYLKARTKKVRKTENSWYFPKSKGHNSVKNRWIETKLELDLYLSVAKQCTKYQMNTWKHDQKKCGKLIYRTDGQSAYLKSPPKLELDMYLSMAKQCTKYQMNIWQHEQKIVQKTDLPGWRTDGQSANLKSPPTSSLGDYKNNRGKNNKLYFYISCRDRWCIPTFYSWLKFTQHIHFYQKRWRVSPNIWLNSW
jgi:hypothetical protein